MDVRVIGKGNNSRMYCKSLHVSICFSLGLALVVYAVDDWDPMDDSRTNGTVLTMGDAAKFHGLHALDWSDDVDWFRINLSSGVVYRFESKGDADIYASLYSDPLAVDPDIGDDDSGNSWNFQIDYIAPESGTFFLEVEAWDDPAYYDLLYYIPANDTDADQLLDSWEVQYFGSTNAQPGAYGDSDIQNNLEEYIAGTDPTDETSFFAITNWSAGSFVVEWWPSVAGREYKVLWAESLTNSFQQIGPMIDPPQNSYTDTAHSAESSGFYKVEVQLK